MVNSVAKVIADGSQKMIQPVYFNSIVPMISKTSMSLVLVVEILGI